MGELGLQFGRIHQVQRLRHAGPHGAFAVTHRGPCRAAEEFQEIMLHLTIPQLNGPSARSHAVKFLLNSSYLAHRIQQHLRRQPPQQGAGIIALIQFVGCVGFAGELIGARGGDQADHGAQVVLVFHQRLG